MESLPLWIFIGFGAQVLWVLGSLIDKFLIEKYFKTNQSVQEEGGAGTFLLFSATFGLAVSACAYLLAPDKVIFDLYPSTIALTVGLLNGLWVMWYLQALDNEEVSRVVPIFQTIPIFGFVFAYLFLGELLTLLQIFGATVVMLGAFVLSYHFEQKAFNLRVLSLMIGASAVVALQETIFKLVAIDSSFWNSTFWLGVGFFMFGFIVFLFVANYRQQFLSFIRSNGPSVWVINGMNEVMDNVAYLAFAFAITLGPVAIVQSVNSYQPLLILLTASIAQLIWPDYYDEDLRMKTLLQKVFGVIIISTGSVLLYLSL